MKNRLHVKSARALLGALLLSAGLCSTAMAQLTFRYEEGPNAGQLYDGAFVIKLFNFDMGTTYANLGADGTASGYGENGTGTQSVGGGISTLNGLPSNQATGARPAGGEDSWGIARVEGIFTPGGQRVWSESASNQQLTIFFYGAQDFYVQQLANGFQEINSVGLRVDLYLQNKSDPLFTAYNFGVQGSAGRTGVASYNTVTDGTRLLETISTPGMIFNNGDFGGLATEFRTNFNAASGGLGQTYLSVIGGSDAARFDTNAFTSPFGTGGTADLFAAFTTDLLGTPSNPAVSDWLVSSQDPVNGLSIVPEPSTYGMMAAGALILAVTLRRRLQKQKDKAVQA